MESKMNTSEEQQNNNNTPFPPSTRKRKSNEQCCHLENQQQKEEEDGSWRDVCKNIERMDALYDATFYTWLKSEENVFVTSMYLYRIANQYPLPRIMNALKWLISDWHLESIRVLVEKVTQDWHGPEGDTHRGILLKHMTHKWAPQHTASLISSILSSPPYVVKQNTGTENEHPSKSEKDINISKTLFLQKLTCDYDYSKLSEFLMYLGSGTCQHSNALGVIDGTSTEGVLDYRIKLTLLKDAARREKEREALKKSHLNNQDNKRPRLSPEDDDLYAFASSSSSPLASPSTTTTPTTHPISNVTRLNSSTVSPRVQGGVSHTHTRNSSMSSVNSVHTRSSLIASPASSINTATTQMPTQDGPSQRSSFVVRPRRYGRRNSYSPMPTMIAPVNDAVASTSATSVSTNSPTSTANALDSAMIRDDANNHKSISATSESTSSSSLTTGMEEDTKSNW